MPPFLLPVSMECQGAFYGDRLFLHPLDRLGPGGPVSIGGGPGCGLSA